MLQRLQYLSQPPASKANIPGSRHGHQATTSRGWPLFVTLLWGGTFVWMKLAMNSLDDEITEYSRAGVVGVIVSMRLFIAFAILILLKNSKKCTGFQRRLEGRIDSWRPYASRLCSTDDRFGFCQPFSFRILNFSLRCIYSDSFDKN